MALKDYYELSAMLRIQLPILLSFAILRCLMGTGTNFWARRIVPSAIQQRAKPVWEATANLLSCIHAALLSAALFYTLLNFSKWGSDPPIKDDAALVCSEFAIPRVQGIVCGMGILGLCTSSDPLTLGLSLSTMKAVADGTVFGIVLGTLAWRASAQSHHDHPWVFFGVLFTCTSAYSMTCYTDHEPSNRTGGSVIASSFACLSVMSKVLATVLAKTWTLWIQIRHAAAKRLRAVGGRVFRFFPPPPVIGPNPADPADSNHQHGD